MIDLKKIKDLIKLMVANDLSEMDVEGDGERVRLKRGDVQPGLPHAHLTPGGGSMAAAGVAPPGGGGGHEAPAADAAGAGGQAQALTIKSPMVGSFYAAPSPDAKPFVAVGDRVAPETLVCIIEAMKVFNEIKAETTGTIDKVLVENGQAVEFGQPLFEVKPS